MLWMKMQIGQDINWPGQLAIQNFILIEYLRASRHWVETRIVFIIYNLIESNIVSGLIFVALFRSNLSEAYSVRPYILTPHVHQGKKNTFKFYIPRSWKIAWADSIAIRLLKLTHQFYFYFGIHILRVEHWLVNLHPVK